MRVYNLTEKTLNFHGRDIPPDGGHAEIPDLDSFVPDRDKELEQKKVISFGALPKNWQPLRHRKVTVADITPAPAEKVTVFSTVGKQSYATTEQPRTEKKKRY